MFFFRTVCINGDNDELTDLTTTAPKDVDAETLGEFPKKNFMSSLSLSNKT